MKFTEWVDKEVQKRRDATVTSVLAKLEEPTGLARATLYNVYKGQRLSVYHKAKRLSEATNGQVTISELCDG